MGGIISERWARSSRNRWAASSESTSLIYRWRGERREAAGFVPAMLVDDPLGEAAGAGAGSTAIVVELAGGARVSIAASASAALRALR
jgi:hypothetical protein